MLFLLRIGLSLLGLIKNRTPSEASDNLQILFYIFTLI